MNQLREIIKLHWTLAPSKQEREVENWLFNTEEGTKYLEEKGWASAEDLKQVRIMQVSNELKE